MKKNGFTMVELMVVISLIIVLSLLITPKINNIIKENRVKGYKEIEKQLEEAANKYIVENYIDTSLNSITLTKSQLMEKHYIDEILDLKDKTVCDASVLVTNLNATPNFTVQLNCSNYTSDNSAPQTGQLIYLNADLNGGKSSQTFGKSYPSGTIVILENPTRQGLLFDRWEVVSGDSTINEGVLTIGSENTLIYALWGNTGVTVIPVLNGGNTSQTFAQYGTGESITLIDPSKEGYVFAGWTCSDPLALSGSTLTIGTTDLTITANWTPKYIITLNSNGASTNGTANINVAYNTTVIDEITNPQRSYSITYNANESGATLSKEADILNYTFDGWYTEQEGGSKVINESGNLIANVENYTDSEGNWIKNEGTTLYAHWTGVQLASITKTGYICGFAETSDGNYAYDNAEVNPNITSDKTLYVKCEKEDYTYSGNYETFTAPKSGYYKVELWGAQGGNAKYTTQYYGGNGAYTSGYVYMNQGEKYYIYVGSQGQSVNVSTPDSNIGYNGGGYADYYSNNSSHGGGGGATDIRYFGNITLSAEQLLWNSELGLNSRIMVAAGGGGASSHSSTPNYSGTGGSGGATYGMDGVPASDTCYSYGLGATQTSAGGHQTCSKDGHTYSGGPTNSAFGVGANRYQFTSGTTHAGGGGGYYGGDAGNHAPGSGGSSFISGYPGCNAITSSTDRTHTGQPNHYSGKVFVKGDMGADINTGNGKAKITYIGEGFNIYSDEEVEIGYNAGYYYKIYQAPKTGYYKVELWGAQGGNAKYTTQYYGGNGAYTSGYLYMNQGENYYIYVGGMGISHSGTSSDTISYNGRGYNGGNGSGLFSSGNSNGGSGGGATDIRYFGNMTPNAEQLLWNSELGLNSRIMVAGGGGGADSHSSSPDWSGNGGSGGTISGADANRAGNCYRYGEGGSQTSGGRSIGCGSYSTENSATFGVGGSNQHSGGGGGYYGGGAGQHTSAGGGSSFISGYSGCNAITSATDRTHTGQPNHYSGKVFINGSMTAGANTGNGKAQITWYGTEAPSS